MTDSGTFLHPFPGLPPVSLTPGQMFAAFQAELNNVHFPSRIVEKEKKMDRVEILKARRDELDAELAALEATPDPAEFEDDAVVCWTQHFAGSEIAYSYVALKKDDRWYVTGSREREVYRNDTFRARLMRKADPGSLMIVTEWSQVQ